MTRAGRLLLLAVALVPWAALVGTWLADAPGAGTIAASAVGQTVLVGLAIWEGRAR